MSVKDRDPYTGYRITGHEWNGITELNTRVPRLLLFALAITLLFSIVYWILLPAWPGIDTYTRGRLGIDQRDEIDQQLKLATATQTQWSERLMSLPINEVLSDKELADIVAQSGPALFRDNCAMCHGLQGEGAQSFPRLNDHAWLWGGTPADILKTLQVGINTGLPGSRIAQMPAFGSSGLLDAESINQVSFYIQSLSQSSIGTGARAEELGKLRAGKAVFTQHCAACHGADAGGNTALGAPNLSDNYAIYGNDAQSIKLTLNKGRAGYMPAWSGRLSDKQLRLLALYVSGLSSKSATVMSNDGEQ
jgi:cytochrome c oxidase cbb3-type subunit 3